MIVHAKIRYLFSSFFLFHSHLFVIVSIKFICIKLFIFCDTFKSVKSKIEHNIIIKKEQQQQKWTEKLFI